jgi:hypothetical protein
MFPADRRIAARAKRRRWVTAALALALAGGQSGCVERRMIVRSNPPGALLYVDNYEIGTTPVATDFIYYGTRQIRLVKDGYETLVVSQPIPAPWYEYFPADFVAENLVPGHIRDVRTLTYNMQPAVQVPQDQLRGRADQLRASVKATQASAALVPGPGSARPLSPPVALPPPVTLPPPNETIPPPSGPLPAPPGTLLPPSNPVPGGAPGTLPGPAPGIFIPPPGSTNYLGPQTAPSYAPPPAVPNYGVPSYGAPNYGTPNYGVPSGNSSPGELGSGNQPSR